MKPKHRNGSVGPAVGSIVHTNGQITSSSLGAPKIMINEPNMMNTAINDMYASQKVQFSHPTTSGSAALKNYHS